MSTRVLSPDTTAPATSLSPRLNEHPHLHSFPTRRSSDLNAMRQAHADGWFIVFDTLTLADDRLEAFYDNPNALSVKNRSEERFSRNAETDLVCRLLLEKKKKKTNRVIYNKHINVVCGKAV